LVHRPKKLCNDRTEERPKRSQYRDVAQLQQAHGRQDGNERVACEPGAACSFQLSGRESSESLNYHYREGNKQCRKPRTIAILLVNRA
jgi:hypothetical protein